MGIGPNPGDTSATAATHREGGRYRLAVEIQLVQLLRDQGHQRVDGFVRGIRRRRLHRRKFRDGRDVSVLAPRPVDTVGVVTGLELPGHLHMVGPRRHLRQLPTDPSSEDQCPLSWMRRGYGTLGGPLATERIWSLAEWLVTIDEPAFAGFRSARPSVA